MPWFIVKLRRHTRAFSEINPGDPAVMRRQVVCLCVVCECVLWLSRHSMLITTGNGLVCTRLTRPRGLIVCRACDFIKRKKWRTDECWSECVLMRVCVYVCVLIMSLRYSKPLCVYVVTRRCMCGCAWGKQRTGHILSLLLLPWRLCWFAQAARCGRSFQITREVSAQRYTPQHRR